MEVDVLGPVLAFESRVPDESSAGDSRRGGGGLRAFSVSPGWDRKAKDGVCTMCTHCPSDWAVPRPDRAGLGMFSGEGRNIKGVNAVRVPPRAQCFRRSGAYLAPEC